MSFITMAWSPETFLNVEDFDYKKFFNVFILKITFKKAKEGKTFATGITHKLQIFSMYDQFL